MSNLSNCFEYKERFGRLDRDLNIIKDFYEPLLANSVKYDRACGYFSSSALSLASKGFSKFCENPNNRMRLIAGAKVHEKDRDAIVNSKEYYEDFVTNILRKELRDSLKEDDYKQFRLKGLAWMLQKKLLDIKICLILDSKGRIMTHQQAEFHPKFGILRDEENNILHFEGGINESRRAWHENWDSICVHASWKDGQKGFIKSSEDEFEALWNVEGRDKKLLEEEEKSDLAVSSANKDKKL